MCPWFNNDNDVTEIICIIDQSGSMCGLQKETIEGFNRFIEEQKEVPGKANVTLVLFNFDSKTVYEGKDINEVEPLTDKTYIPDGGTALLDTMGSTIADVKKRIFAMETDDQPGRVLFCIITDGQENASKEYKKESITKLLADCEKDYTWAFSFLSADMKAIEEASSLGFSKGMMKSFMSTKSGIERAYSLTSGAATTYRTVCKADIESGTCDYMDKAEELLDRKKNRNGR